MSSDRPLFSQVGRAPETPVRASSRIFNLLIVLGLLLAVGAFLVEMGTRPKAMRYVEVEMGLRADE